MDQVHDGLGLTQVHLSVQKSPLRKFTGFRGTTAAREQILQNHLGNQGISVRRNFQRILAGVGARALEKCAQHIV